MSYKEWLEMVIKSCHDNAKRYREQFALYGNNEYAIAAIRADTGEQSYKQALWVYENKQKGVC